MLKRKLWRLAHLLKALPRNPVMVWLTYFAWKKNHSKKQKDYLPPKNLEWDIPILNMGQKEFADYDENILNALAEKYLSHQFDLLGSGWVNVSFSSTPKGLEGICFSHKGEHIVKDSVAASFISEAYTPIDWSVDYKTGHRWENKWHHELSWFSTEGADIKAPWELSRSHHLPQLALAYGKSQNQKIVQEFQDQVADFLSQHPCGYGVSWKCPMATSIRAANWVVAYDLFTGFGAKFSEEFDAFFKNSLWQHGAFIYDNLEWDPVLRTNHYYSNLGGLSFVARRLIGDESLDHWLCFSSQQLELETLEQFYSDGGNFEASTSYHRLSTEIGLYAAHALASTTREREVKANKSAHQFTNTPCLIRVPKFHRPKQSLWLRLAAAVRFTEITQRPNDTRTQIGDTDSGRFLKLNLGYKIIEGVLEEMQLDHSHLSQLWKKLSTQLKIPYMPPHPLNSRLESKNTEEKFLKLYEKVSEEQKITYEYSWPTSEVINDLKTYAFPEFGLYVFRGSEFYLSLRCGSVGQNDVGGHCHNDQLALELQVSGTDVVADPGTYLYSPLPERRNEYRSIRSHFAPVIERDGEWVEPHDLSMGLFQIVKPYPARCLNFTENSFWGVHTAYGSQMHRFVKIDENGLKVYDCYLGKDKFVKREAFSVSTLYSPAYGWQISQQRSHIPCAKSS